MKKVITRKELIDRLSSESGYYKYNIRDLLVALDKVIFECFDELVDDGDEITIQLLENVKLHGKVLPERSRKDPRTQDDIVCQKTLKPRAIFSNTFRKVLNEQLLDQAEDGE